MIARNRFVVNKCEDYFTNLNPTRQKNLWKMLTILNKTVCSQSSSIFQWSQCYKQPKFQITESLVSTCFSTSQAPISANQANGVFWGASMHCCRNWVSSEQDNRKATGLDGISALPCGNCQVFNHSILIRQVLTAWEQSWGVSIPKTNRIVFFQQVSSNLPTIYTQLGDGIRCAHSANIIPCRE